MHRGCHGCRLQALDFDAFLVTLARLGVHKYRPLGMAADAAVAGMFANVLNQKSEQEVVSAARKSGAIPATLPDEGGRPRQHSIA